MSSSQYERLSWLGRNLPQSSKHVKMTYYTKLVIIIIKIWAILKNKREMSNCLKWKKFNSGSWTEAEATWLTGPYSSDMGFNGSELVSHQIECLGHRLLVGSPAPAVKRGLDGPHHSAAGRGKEAHLGNKNLIVKKLKHQAHTTHLCRCGVWTDTLQVVQGIVKTKSNIKSVSKPVNLPYRGTSTAQGNPDSHEHNTLWRWPHNKKLKISNETNCQKENKQMQ